MTQIDKTAVERINELEGQLFLSEEDNDDLRIQLQVALAQIKYLKNGQQADLGVA